MTTKHKFNIGPVPNRDNVTARVQINKAQAYMLSASGFKEREIGSYTYDVIVVSFALHQQIKAKTLDFVAASPKEAHRSASVQRTKLLAKIALALNSQFERDVYNRNEEIERAKSCIARASRKEVWDIRFMQSSNRGCIDVRAYVANAPEGTYVSPYGESAEQIDVYFKVDETGGITAKYLLWGTSREFDTVEEAFCFITELMNVKLAKLNEYNAEAGKSAKEALAEAGIEA